MAAELSLVKCTEHLAPGTEDHLHCILNLGKYEYQARPATECAQIKIIEGNSKT